MLLSIGKMRGLQQCATPSGAISVLALDHRNNLRKALRPDAPQTVTWDEMVDFKQQVIAAVAPASSAVLLDPEFGAAQCVASGALPGQVGLIVAVEGTGYTDDPAARQSALLPGWSVDKARRMGASAVKLLVYYHPDSPSVLEVEALVARVAADCARFDIPLFLEPLSYSLDPTRKKLSPDERHRVVVETARRLTTTSIDVLKAEFPLDIAAHLSEADWLEACSELSRASRVPWVLLSAAVNYETYLRQVEVACRAGASGVAVGRAVWQESVELRGEERVEFLRSTAAARMREITSVCDATARPWTEFYSTYQVAENWYARY